MAARPEDARPHAGAVDALGLVARVVGAVVVLTGRPAHTVVTLGGLSGASALTRLVVLGHYGLERWDAATGVVSAPPPHPGVERARSRLSAVLAEADAPDGTVVEDKGASLAVHVRQVADPVAALDRLRSPLEALAADCGLEIVPGRLVLELRPPGVDKGSALERFVEERAARSVLFVGDDLGDLPAYDAVDALRSRGVPGVKVCSGSDEVTALRERADVVVDGPAGVVTFLRSLAAAIGSDVSG